MWQHQFSQVEKATSKISALGECPFYTKKYFSQRITIEKVWESIKSLKTENGPDLDNTTKCSDRNLIEHLQSGYYPNSWNKG